MNSGDPLHRLLVSAIRHQEANEVEEARDLYLQILEQDPQHEQALHLAGLLCLQNNELDGAQSLLEAAAEVDPNNASYPNHLGVVALRRQDLAGAAALFRKSISLDSG